MTKEIDYPSLSPDQINQAQDIIKNSLNQPLDYQPQTKSELTSPTNDPYQEFLNKKNQTTTITIPSLPQEPKPNPEYEQMMANLQDDLAHQKAHPETKSPQITFGKKLKMAIAGALVAVGLGGAVGCEAQTPPSAIESPAPSDSSAHTPLPSEGTSENPSPSATQAVETLDPQKEAEERLNQQINDFLNNEGEYTDERLNGMLFSTKILSERMTNESDLGLITDVSIQGLLLNVQKKDNSAVLTLGLKDRDGKRFVTCVELPTYFYESLEGKTGEMKMPFSFNKKEKNYPYSSLVGDPEVFYKADDILNKIEGLNGEIVIITPYVQPQIESMSNYNYDDSNYNDIKEFMTDFSENVSQRRYLNNKLFYSVWQNDLKPSDKDFSTSNTKKVKLPKIESASDINKVNLEDIPIISQPLVYFLKK